MVRPKIGAIIVLYQPDWSVTGPAVRSISGQVDTVCLLDNTPGGGATEPPDDIPNVNYISLGKNLGIAAAQNEGIRYFLSRGYDFVLFSDQDSMAPDNLVANLHDGYSRLERAGIKIATVGTRAINKQTGQPYPPKSKELGAPAELNGEKKVEDLTECYSVRSSMSLTSMTSIIEAGGFDEGLFIDGVDHEWCWRAWHNAGLRSFIVETAKIDHMLGEGDRKLAGKNVAIPSPFRVYYQFRNYIWLSKRPYTPKFWISRNRKKYLVKTFYFPIMLSPHMKFLKNIFRGIKDGFNKKDPMSWPNFQVEKD